MNSATRPIETGSALTLSQDSVEQDIKEADTIEDEVPSQPDTVEQMETREGQDGVKRNEDNRIHIEEDGQVDGQDGVVQGAETHEEDGDGAND